MLTTRSPLPRRVLGTAAVPALLLGFTACGDDDGDDTSADFCDTAVEIDEQFATADFEDPEAIAEVTATMAEVDPPDEIADDWNLVLEAYQAIAEVDMEDPEAVTELQQNPQFENIDESADNVETYLQDECGLE